MSRPNVIFTNATNRLLRYFDGLPIGERVPPENDLAETLGVSRGAVRYILKYTEDRGIIVNESRKRQIMRKSQMEDFFGDADVVAPSDLLERLFLRKINDGAIVPNQRFSELSLARAVDVSIGSAREFLLEFSRFGLVEKQARGGWILRGFDRKYAIEIADMRTMIEMAAIRRIRQVGLTDAQLGEVRSLLRDHLLHVDARKADFTGWADLDNRFHEWLIAHMDNRFMFQLTKGIAVAFSLHFQSDEQNRLRRMAVAVEEHIVILSQLAERDFLTACESVAAHMTTERDNLLRSIEGKT
ncbi:MAG: GntR family transcriptional regulator [Rhizobium sp.]|nr:GntR family transcriptional regulator [Rhizobium sp.]